MIIKAILLCIIGVVSCVEVHFENKDGGFFLKHTGRGAGGPGSGSGGVGAAPLSVDRFTVFQTARAVSVRASYGPFSTKQTVPARSLVPDPLAPFPGSKNSSVEQTPLRIDMSAHVVSREISRDSPVIRVLFHTGGEAGGRVCGVVHATMGNRPSLAGACSPEGGEGACLAQLEVPANWWGPLQPPPAMKDGKAVPPLKQPPKMVQLAYSILEPRAADPEGGGCMPRVQIQPATRLGSVQLVPARAPFKELRADDSLALLAPRTPLYPLARFHLPVFVRHEEIPVTYFIMRCRVKSGLRLLGAVSASDQWTVTVELKPKLATVTAVRKDFSDQQTPPNSEEVFTWAAEAGGAAGRGSARLSCSVKYARSGNSPMASPLTIPDSEGDPEVTEHPAPRKIVLRMDIDKDDIQAVLPISKNWEVLNTAVITGRQVSQAMKVLIVSQAGQVADVTLQSSCHSEDESVLKVSSSCSSVYVDGSEIRSSSNASVIVKYGTYTGLARFTVWMPEFPLEVNVDDFRLSQVKGWKVPEEGNANSISKSRGFRRRKRSYSQPIMEEISNSVTPERHSCRLRFQQSPVDVYARFLATDHDSGRVSYLVSRRTWLRVTELVLPLLRVADPRLANLRGRLLRGKATGRTEVQVLSPITGRVIGSREIRVGSDKVSISRLIVRVISGLQLNISPDNAIENGYISETTVTRRLTAQYQEGLLDIDIEFSDGSRTPLRDVAVEDYVLKVESLDPDVVAFAPMVASRHPRVIAVGEGNGELLRVTLLLSEECRGAAGIIPKTRGSSSKVDQGGSSGTGVLLATATASVEVDFSASEVPQRPDTPQNDDIMRSGAKGPLADLHDILIGIPLKDENNHEPTVQARQLGGNSGPGGSRGDRRRHAPHMTPVEIGMYVLLAAFCFAIVIFVVSCVVYASKFKPMGPDTVPGIGPAMPLQPIAPDSGKIQVAGLIGTSLGIGRDNRKLPRESTTNAHDWVWLGRATIERHTGHQVQAVNRNSSQQPSVSPAPPPPPPHASDIANRNVPREMRITNNPLNMNYADPDDAIKPADNNNGNAVVSSIDNPNHIDLAEPDRRGRSHSNDNRIVDSTTYCKRDRLGRAGKHNGADAPKSWQPDTSSPTPPPLPPHAAPLDNHVVTPAEYRPPVPPHRTSQPPPPARTKVLADTIMPPTRRSHHTRHHWKASDKPHSHNSQSQPLAAASPRKSSHHDNRITSKPQQVNIGYSEQNTDNGNSLANDLSELGNVNSLVNNLSKVECSGMFEFDEDVQMTEATIGQMNNDIRSERESSDAKKESTPSAHSPDLMKDSGIGLSEVVYRPKVPKHATQSVESTSGDFVEIVSDSNGTSSRGSSPEVKRATIVGNPMFSDSPTNNSITDDLPTESLGLDDLEMDYEQIMHYFHNLKESNA